VAFVSARMSLNVVHALRASNPRQSGFVTRLAVGLSHVGEFTTGGQAPLSILWAHVFTSKMPPSDTLHSA
jgi:hypothetical protein